MCYKKNQSCDLSCAFVSFVAHRNKANGEDPSQKGKGGFLERRCRTNNVNLALPKIDDVATVSNRGTVCTKYRVSRRTQIISSRIIWATVPLL